ncbi:hypothetical protein VST7929_01032 [Vibrio stylophorae]|uniref:DUF924 domain-containing protein n=1 Tax=Vibrio stylophorae TaxID=659351 RepID=A0ABM8ZS90_9VIBR|nr:DUF924 family protein [Vibrio stylophorae]CAH0533170.1 hypothetical protein VST7929_01032 [Vibrio stylophorae]
MSQAYQVVLDYWFGELNGEITKDDQMQKWFAADSDLDDEIRQRFQTLVSAAGSGHLADWAQSPKGTLALIILLDQFPRNLYRGLSAAFRFDAMALAYCRRGLAQEFDMALSPIERVFFYLPLEHSEQVEDQEESMFRFDQLRKVVSTRNRPLFDNFYAYAQQHQSIIDEFGRYPHRNACLGRLSTSEERHWLAKHQGGFGQSAN